MAISGYLARMIYKTHEEDSSTGATKVEGTYKKIVDAKSMPSPVSAPNPIETTTLEDDVQKYIMGIKASDSKEITGNLEKEYLDAIDDLGDGVVDVFQLYGNDGVGSTAKYFYSAQVAATPSDIGGTDEVAEMTVTVIPNTSALKCTDDYTVTDNGDGTLTVAKK